jgi:hypothetical protein
VSVALNEITPVAGRQRGGFSECLSRILPSRLACRVLAAADADRHRVERDPHDEVRNV